MSESNCKSVPSKNEQTSTMTVNDINLQSATPQSQAFPVPFNQLMSAANEQPWRPSKQDWIVMVTMAVSSLMVALDATILVSVLPTLAVEFNGTAIQAFWTGTSYLLTHAVLQPFIAAISDAFGRRAPVVFSLMAFTIGSVFCGSANKFTPMLIGRVIQGIGGAGIITLSQLIYADIIPLRQRPKYFTMILGAWAIGSVLGPLIGGLFVEKATWRWCFFINLPICAIGLFMSVFTANFPLPSSYQDLDFLDRIRRIDCVGNISLISGLTLTLIAVSWGGIQHPWSSAATVAPLVVGISILTLTIIYEARYAKHPFLSHSLLFKSTTTKLSYTCALIQGLTLYMALYYVSFYFSAVHFKSPIDSGLALFPATTFILPGSAIVSALITRTGTYRWAIWAGFVLSTLASGLFILLDSPENKFSKIPVWATFEAIFGLGMGMILSSLNFSIQATVETADTGRSAAMYAFFRSIGMCIGVALGGSVFQNTMQQKLQHLGVQPAEQIARHAESYVEVLKSLTDEKFRHLVLKGYVAGFRGVFVAMCAMCGVGLLMSLTIQHGNLDRILPIRTEAKAYDEEFRGQEEKN